MFLNLHGNKFIAIVRLIAFWGGLFAMFALFIVLVNDDLKIPQKTVTVKLDVRNKINICLPEDDKIFEESFFDF